MCVNKSFSYVMFETGFLGGYALFEEQVNLRINDINILSKIKLKTIDLEYDYD